MRGKAKKQMENSVGALLFYPSTFPNTIDDSNWSRRDFFPGSTKCRGAAGKWHAENGERRAPARAPEH